MQLLIEPESSFFQWSYITGFLNRYKWLILAVFLTVIIGGWVALQVFFNDIYETKATLLVKVGRENTEVPTTVVHGSLLSQGVRIQDINSEVQIMNSPDLVEKVVDKIGADKFKSILAEPSSIWGYPKYWMKLTARYAKGVYKDLLIALNLKKRLTHREEVIVAVRESLVVEPVKESDVLVVKLRLPSQQLAVETTNGILDEYLRRRAEVRGNVAGFEFFNQEAQQLQSKLEDLSTRRAEVRSHWNVSSTTEQRTMLLQQITNLEAQKINVESRIRSLEPEHLAMKERLKTLPAFLTKEEQESRNPALESLKERITALQMERARTLGRYQEDSETVKKLNAEIESLEKSLAAEKATILASTTSQPNPLREDFLKGIEVREVEMIGLRAQLKKLDDAITDFRSQLQRLNRGGDQMETAERELHLIEQQYLALSKRREEARVAQELDSQRMANVSIIALPEFPLEPVAPKKLFIMGILIPLGLLLGVGFSILMETMNDRIREEGDFDLLGSVPYLGHVQILTPERRRLT